MAACTIAIYTTVDAVRGCLGLTDNEVTDAMVVDQNMDLDLLLDLSEWLPTHADIWTASFTAPVTDEEKLHGMMLQMYAQWYCAVRLCEMWLAFPQRISDGKADMRRFSEIDLEKLLAMANSRMMKFRSRLEDEVLGLPARGTTMAALSSPNYDPVTGAES